MVLYILSQVFAALALCAVFVGFLCRKKAYLIFWVAMCNIFLTLSYACLFKWMPVAILAVATVRMFVFLALERRRGKVPTWLNIGCLAIFLVATLVATVLTWDMWFEFVLMAGVMLYTYGVWSKGEHKVRIAGIIVSIIAIIYNVLVTNYTAIGVDFATLVSIVAFYGMKWYNLRRRDKDEKNAVLPNRRNSNREELQNP
jgi:hypothetical protein